MTFLFRYLKFIGHRTSKVQSSIKQRLLNANCKPYRASLFADKLMQCLIKWCSYTSIYNHTEAYKHLLQYFTLHLHTDCVNLDNFFIITELQQSITKKHEFCFHDSMKEVRLYTDQPTYHKPVK